MKKVKYLLIWFSFLALSIYVLWPEIEHITMTDGTESSDSHIVLLDLADWAMKPNSKFGEAIEGIHWIISIVMLLFIGIQTFIVFLSIKDSRSWDVYEVPALIVSYVTINLITFGGLFLLSLIAFWSPWWSFGLVCVYGLGSGISYLIAANTMGEDNHGIYNVYDSAKKYYKNKHEYDSYIDKLKHQYKTAIQ